MTHHPSPSRKPLTNALIAKHFHVHPSTVADWIIQGCPKSSIKDVSKWRSETLRTGRGNIDDNRNGAENEPQMPALQRKRIEADTRKILADVALRELRIEEKRRDLVSRSEVVRELSEIVVRVKERLLAAPDEFENRFPAGVRVQCKLDFQEFIRQLLLELSRMKVADATMDDTIVASAAAIIAGRSRTAAAMGRVNPERHSSPVNVQHRSPRRMDRVL